MDDENNGRGSIYFTRFISRIINLMGFMEFSKVRMQKIFPFAKELKAELKNFGKTARKTMNNKIEIPSREDLNDGYSRITIKRSHKEALDFMFKDFNYTNYLLFLHKHALQLIFTEFDNYLVSLCSHILKKRPDLLGDLNISAEKIAKMKKEDIFEEKISKKMHDMFYDGYEDIINRYMSKKLGIKHKIEEKKMNQLLELKLIRDIYIHGEGEVNQIYLKKSKRKDRKLGEKIPLNLDTINEILSVTQSIITQLDKNFIKGYKETIDSQFRIIDFLKARDELEILFPRNETEEGVRNL